MQNNKPKIGTVEEITDMIDPRAYEDKNFKKGMLLKFTEASLVITKIDRKNKRTWARHTQTFSETHAASHYNHNVDITEESFLEFGGPYCTDCEVVIGDEATLAGKKKAQRREDMTLPDGTVIGDEKK